MKFQACRCAPRTNRELSEQPLRVLLCLRQRFITLHYKDIHEICQEGIFNGPLIRKVKKICRAGRGRFTL